MPKQVRFRRGTTAQHATFIGADGEVTFDTTKKVLVLHDGVTPGGKPAEGFLILDPGNPLLVQTVESIVSITGGDSDSFGLIVTQQARFDAIITAQAGIYPRRIQMQHEAIVYAPSVNLDFNGVAHKRIALGGDLSLTATNMDYGKSLLLRIAADGSARTLSFPAGCDSWAARRPSRSRRTRSHCWTSNASASTEPTSWPVTSLNHEHKREHD